MGRSLAERKADERQTQGSRTLDSLQVPRWSWSSKLLPSPNKSRPGLEGKKLGPYLTVEGG